VGGPRARERQTGTATPSALAISSRNRGRPGGTSAVDSPEPTAADVGPDAPSPSSPPGYSCRTTSPPPEGTRPNRAKSDPQQQRPLGVEGMIHRDDGGAHRMSRSSPPIARPARGSASPHFHLVLRGIPGGGCWEQVPSFYPSPPVEAVGQVRKCRLSRAGGQWVPSRRWRLKPPHGSLPRSCPHLRRIAMEWAPL
jgi:hypothetical protein